MRVLPKLVLPPLIARGPWHILSPSGHQEGLPLGQKWELTFSLRHGEIETRMDVKIFSSPSLENSSSWHESNLFRGKKSALNFF